MIHYEKQLAFFDSKLERKIEILYDKDDVGLRNGVVILRNETATMGNALRHILSQEQEVVLCGYFVPHPTLKEIHLRIQTSERTSVPAAFHLALERLDAQTRKLCQLFTQ